MRQPALPATDTGHRSWGSEEVALPAGPRSSDGRARPGSRRRETLLDDAPTTAIPREVAPGRHFLPEGQRERFQRGWDEVQARFVDDPGKAVSAAELLLDEVMASFCEGMEAERAAIALGGDAGIGEVPTEALRQMLQGYRSLLQRLLSA